MIGMHGIWWSDEGRTIFQHHTVDRQSVASHKVRKVLRKYTTNYEYLLLSTSPIGGTDTSFFLLAVMVAGRLVEIKNCIACG